MRRRHDDAGDWLGLDPRAEVLVVTSPDAPDDAFDRWPLPAGATRRPLAGPPPRTQPRDAVVLLVRDLADLRRCVAALPAPGTARLVLVGFSADVDPLPAPAVHPQWPRVERLVAGRVPGAHVAVELAEPTPARAVLVEVARAAGSAPRFAVEWPLLGAERNQPEGWPVADPAAKVAGRDRLLDQTVESPPDLARLVDPGSVEPPEGDHEVLGRPTLVVGLGPDPTWDDLAGLSPAGQRELAERAAPRVGAVDDQVFNPIGFDRDVLGDPVAAPEPSRTPGEVGLRTLRGVPGVRTAWSGGRGPLDVARHLVHLAAAGVPLVVDEPPVWAEPLLGAGLVQALTAPVDLGDRLRREETSVRQRRAALQTHAARPWRRRLAARHGLRHGTATPVSVLLVTRRSDMLPFALRQVGRQRGVELELVLVTHGFEPEQGLLASHRERGGDLTHVAVEASVPFGQVMDRAVAAAHHDVVVKMDDDDWYGPDFVADLLLARDYSGADVVGCPPELTYLEPLGVTTRSSAPTEVYRGFVAGGTIMTTRGVVGAVGGFRDTRKYVDANLLAAVVASGGTVYRTHGLGYVLRRGASGHTWDPGMAYFLRAERAREQWRGFRPSALLEPADLDLPASPAEDGR